MSDIAATVRKRVRGVARMHAAYRCVMDAPHRWRGYTIGRELAVEADTLPQARVDLVRQLRDQLSSWPDEGLVEHTEHALGEGLWVREALDDRVLERAHTTRVVLDALSDRRLRARLGALPAESGGVVVLAAVPGDTVAWVLDQHDVRGTLVVATAVSNHQLWWTALLPADQVERCELPVLDGVAAFDVDSTVDDWLAAVDCGRAVPVRERSAERTG